MKKNNILLLVDSKEKVEAFKKESNITFLFPVKGYTVGFPNAFLIDEIKEEGYVFINRILDNEGISNFKLFLRELPENIKGIVFDDIGVLNVLLKEKNNLKKILFLNHMNSNFLSINAYLEYVDSVVVSTDITTKELDEILSQVTKPVVLYTFGYVNIMYSRRNLITNYNNYFSQNEKKISTLEESSSHKKIKLVENEFGTVAYTNLPFNGLDYLNKKPVLFNLINTLFLNISDIKEILEHPQDLNLKYPYKYLSAEETIFKLKGEGK